METACEPGPGQFSLTNITFPGILPEDAARVGASLPTRMEGSKNHYYHDDAELWDDSQTLPPGVSNEGASALMPTITVDDLRQPEDVVATVDALDEAKATQGSARLDFSSLSYNRQARISPQYGAILGNLIVSRYSELPLVVQFPEAPTAQLQLARAGILFALARHQRLHVNNEEDGTFASSMLTAWRSNWTPADSQLALFDYSGSVDGEQPRPLDRNLLAFLNPDQLNQRQREMNTEAVMYPWLHELMTQKDVVTTRSWRRYLSRQANITTTELLDNIRYHASLRTADLCAMTAFTTGDTRLYLSVSDTGVGVASSLAGRYGEQESVAAFKRALEGKLPLGPRGSGRGLSDLIDRVNELGARFFCASGPGPEGAGALIVDHRGDLQAPVPDVEHVPGLAMRGTIVMVTLPLQQPQGFEP